MATNARPSSANRQAIVGILAMSFVTLLIVASLVFLGGGSATIEFARDNLEVFLGGTIAIFVAVFFVVFRAYTYLLKLFLNAFANEPSLDPVPEPTGAVEIPAHLLPGYRGSPPSTTPHTPPGDFSYSRPPSAATGASRPLSGLGTVYGPRTLSRRQFNLTMLTLMSIALLSVVGLFVTTILDERSIADIFSKIGLGSMGGFLGLVFGSVILRQQE